MRKYQNLVIEQLSTIHERKSFSCGDESLNTYIQKQAKQDIKRRIGRVFVATLKENPSTIIGYYSLSSLSIELNELPESQICKLPKYPVPAALIGRLAVDKNAKGYGIGKMLLTDAIKRTIAVSNNIAIYAIVVDALDSNAEAFYKQFGFSHLNNKGKRLFLPLKSFQP